MVEMKKGIETMKQVNDNYLYSNDLLTTKYSVPTENNFAVLATHSDSVIDETKYTKNQDSLQIYSTETNNHQRRRANQGNSTETNNRQGGNGKQRKRSHIGTTLHSLYHNKDKYDHQVNEKNEEPGNYIPTIVNGIISNTFTLESTLVNSAIISDVKGDSVHRAAVELGETIQSHPQKDNPYIEHKVIVIGDSNMRGVASTLQTLLGCN